MKVVIQSLYFHNDNFPMVADVHYCLKGHVSELNGQMRIPVPPDFIEQIEREATEILKYQINQIDGNKAHP